MLSNAILMEVADTELVNDPLRSPPSALQELIASYMRYAMADASLPIVDKRTTGAEFKEAFVKLKPEAQVELLHAYCIATRTLLPAVPYEETSAPRATEDPKVSTMLTRIFVLLVMIFICVLLGAVLAAAAFTGALSNALSSQLVVTASEIIKFIFSPSKVP